MIWSMYFHTRPLAALLCFPPSNISTCPRSCNSELSSLTLLASTSVSQVFVTTMLRLLLPFPPLPVSRPSLRPFRPSSSFLKPAREDFNILVVPDLLRPPVSPVSLRVCERVCVRSESRCTPWATIRKSGLKDKAQAAIKYMPGSMMVHFMSSTCLTGVKVSTVTSKAQRRPLQR